MTTALSDVDLSAGRRSGVRVSTAIFWFVFTLSLAPTLAALPGGPESAPQTYRIASTAGLVALLAIEWQVVLGVRQVTAWLRIDRDLAMRVHTVLGVASGTAVVLHPLLWRLAQEQPLSFVWQLQWGFTEARFVSLGRIALGLFLMVWLTSTLARYALTHRWWHALHVLAYPMLVLALVHSWAATGALAEHPVLRAYWWLTALLSAGAIVVRVVAPWAVRPSTITARDALPGGVALRVAGGAGRPAIEPGQFVTVRSRRWRSGHPYSVTAQESDGALWLGVAKVGRQSSELAALDIGDVVYVDGGHGRFTADSPDRRTRVFIAAGYGVTPFVWRLVDLEANHDLDDTHVFQLVRQRRNLVFGSELGQLLGPRHHVIARDERERFSVAEIDPRLLAEATFWICGPPTFTEQIARNLRRAGVTHRRTRVEHFG